MRILLVGTGEHGTAELARSLTAGNGIQADVVGDGSGALEILLGQPFDAVITQLDIGPLDGIELVRRIRLRRPRLPVLMLAGNATVDRAVAAMRAGATDFLPRSVQPGALLALVRRAVGDAFLRDQADRQRSPAGPRPNGDRLVVRDGGALVLAGFGSAADQAEAPEPAGVLMPAGLTLAEVERRYLEAALHRFEGDYSSLAMQLGISRKTLWEKRRRLALERGRLERTRARSRTA
ncbi:MAG: response regulator [Gemmatimonadetes bacterium]|nr:response regulator [Gemmatimonadota bacterium]